MTDHDKLRALAEEATPGPWESEECFSPSCWCKWISCAPDKGMGGSIASPASIGRDDADYIAATSPDVVIALLDEIAALKKRIPGDPRDGVNWGGK